MTTTDGARVTPYARAFATPSSVLRSWTSTSQLSHAYLARGYIDPGIATPVVLGVVAGATVGARLLTGAKPAALRDLFALHIIGNTPLWSHPEIPMTTPLGTQLELPLPFDEALARVRDALQVEGFGVLTQIDMKAAFREKLGKDFRPFAILGACNPPLAFQALSADPAVGLLLPCNVTVEGTEAGQSVVRLTDPTLLLGSGALAENPILRQVASDASERLERVSAALATAAGPLAS